MILAERAPDRVGYYNSCVGTTMSNLPCELLDHIVDLLYNSQTFGRIPPELRDCSLVSKSWVPRTRRHLFADIHFQTAKRLESWKKAFPDPSTSPACYAKLFVDRRAPSRHGRGCGSGVDKELLWCRALGTGRSRRGRPRVGGRFRPVPRILTCHQISPHENVPPSIPTLFRSRPFIPSSRGLEYGRLSRCADRRSWR